MRANADRREREPARERAPGRPGAGLRCHCQAGPLSSGRSTSSTAWSMPHKLRFPTRIRRQRTQSSEALVQTTASIKLQPAPSNLPRHRQQIRRSSGFLADLGYGGRRLRAGPTPSALPRRRRCERLHLRRVLAEHEPSSCSCFEHRPAREASDHEIALECNLSPRSAETGRA